MWTELFGQLGMFGIGVTAIGVLSKMLLTHLFDQGIEKYKLGLQATHDVEMEKLRNALTLKSIEHEIRFRSVHEKQATVMAETYAKIYEVHKTVSSYVAILEQGGDPSKEEKLKLVATAYEAFRDCFYPQRIFFPKETGRRVMDFANKLTEVTNMFTHGQQREARMVHNRRTSENEAAAAFDHWDKTHKMMQDEVPPLLEQLEGDFQRLLGVTTCPGESESQSGSSPNK